MRYKSINFIIIFFLIISCFLVYWQVTHHDFINFDDGIYVTENSYVRNGLTWQGLIWAFSHDKSGTTYWHPVTWISHMLDVKLFDLHAGMHHLVNLLFHIANSILLYVLLLRMTGMIWQSAFVAALFALHPINVETVAWVAERKNLLSTFLWMLTMLSYSSYVVKRRISLYVVTLFVFTLGLLAKPLLVTLPFVLLILDYWPLGRMRVGTLVVPRANEKLECTDTTFRFLLIEKIPFFMLSAFSIIATALSQTRKIIPFDAVSISLRVSNAIIAYMKYMGKMIWPVDLVIYYPFPQEMLPLWQVAGSFLILSLISAIVIVQIKKKPYLFIGWFWFLGTLVPMSGLIQNGLWPAMADRWAYIPFIGLYIMIAWAVPDVTAQRRYKKIFMAGLATTVLALLASLTISQLQYWKDSMTLFQHDITISGNNVIAHNNIGRWYYDHGDIDKALIHFLKAIKIDPNYANANINIGLILQGKGKFDEAIRYYLHAIQVDPNNVESHNNLGTIFYTEGKIDEAIAHYQKALEVDPNLIKIRNNLGVALFKLGKYSEAIEQFNRAIQIDPQYQMAHENLEKALSLKAKPDN